MKSTISYACDTEFTKLLYRGEDIDLPRAALELARDAYPDLTFEPTLEWIDARADELAGRMARTVTDRDLLSTLGECLAEEFGLNGRQEAYQFAESSYLNRVIETGCGIPISLSVIYMAVAQSAGIDLLGVGVPVHFITRYESPEGPLFLDAFSQGRVMAQEECVEWLASWTQLPAGRIRRSLQPVSGRAIITRMLNNLKALHLGQEDWNAAWIVQNRLMALSPTSYEDRRDLALISLQANRPGQAIRLFEECLRNCPQDESSALTESLTQARRDIARWN